MIVKVMTNEKEIENLKVLHYVDGVYKLRSMQGYHHIMIVGNIVVNISCNSKSVNNEIVERIKNNDYNVCGIMGVLQS